MARISLKDIEKDDGGYAIQSKALLNKSLQAKFKKVFGGTLYFIETLFKNEIDRNPEKYKELRSAILRLGNDNIRNMLQELDLYNVYRIPNKYYIKFIDDKESV